MAAGYGQSGQVHVVPHLTGYRIGDARSGHFRAAVDAGQVRIDHDVDMGAVGNVVIDDDSVVLVDNVRMPRAHVAENHGDRRIEHGLDGSI